MRSVPFLRLLTLVIGVVLAVALSGDGSVFDARSAAAQTSTEASDLPSEPATTAEASLDSEPAPTNPELFDLDLATRSLAQLEREAAEMSSQISESVDRTNQLTVDRDFLDLNGPARAETLQSARSNARQMAIAAYVGVGPPLQGIEVLNAETASDMSWRNAIIRQQTRRLSDAASNYAVLADEADSSLLELSDQINAESRRREAMARSLARTTAEIPKAKWFVSIAEIHDVADGEFARTGRAEPTPEQWQKLRRCESTETYNIDSGNFFYGAYQFTWETWGTVGGDDNPALAPPAEQDARARLLYSRRGSQPWPICGRYLP